VSDEKFLSDSSDDVGLSGVCEDIPQDSSAWPFTIASDNDGDGHDSTADDGDDCRDDDASSYTGASESCNNTDDDCDGSTDEDLGSTTCGVGVCEHTVSNCSGGVIQTCNPLEGVSTEICGDGIDQNCDGSDTSCDSDGDGVSDVDEVALGTSISDSDSDDDGLSDGDEVTLGTDPLSSDTDGDGITDGSDSDPLTALDLAPIFSLLLDGDNDGDTYDSTDDGGEDCDDDDATIYPGATEVCNDGIDQDCSGSDTSCDTDGDGVNDTDEIAEGSDPYDATSTACILPTSETDWIVTQNCTVFRAKTWAGDLHVQDGAVMTVPAGISLDLDFSAKKLMVQSGSGVLIVQGGTLH
jgi:hypothetical protein